MLQVIHDIAPKATLAFATAQGTAMNMANNIKNLATLGCKVICDDILYLTEPMFSDGIVGQAIDKVTGLGATYFSSAGN